MCTVIDPNQEVHVLRYGLDLLAGWMMMPTNNPLTNAASVIIALLTRVSGMGSRTTAYVFSVTTCVFSFPALQNVDYNLGICGWLLVFLSLVLTVITLPVSIWMCTKVSIRLKSLFIFPQQIIQTQPRLQYQFQSKLGMSAPLLTNLQIYIDPHWSSKFC